MSNIYQLMNTAQWALHAQQLGMSVTAHNIANLNTPGYSRQTLILESSTPMDWAPGQLGTGVRAVAVKRIYDQFLGLQLQEELSQQGRVEAERRLYEQLESIFSLSEEAGLSADLQAFWDAWEDLSNHPEGHAERVAVREAGLQLARRLQVMYDDLKQLQDQMDESVRIAVEKVNELTEQIAGLNERIFRAEAAGQDANDVRDQRDQRIRELAELLDVRSWEEDGKVTVLGPGGRLLVSGLDAWRLRTEVDESGRVRVLWEEGTGRSADITQEITSGTLGGTMEMRDRVVLGHLETLDSLARELIWQVNAIHCAASGTSPWPELSSTVAVPDYDPLSGSPPLMESSLPFASRITAGEIHIWVYDGDPPVPGGRIEVMVDASTTLQDVADQINSDPDNGGRLTATVYADGTLTLSAANGAGFSVARDDSHLLAALGMGGFFGGSGAGSIEVAQGVRTTTDRIAAGRVDEDGGLTGTAGSLAPGDNRAALAVAALRNAPVLEGASLAEVYAAQVGELGLEASSAYRAAEYQEMVVQEVEDQLSSVSGVSVDEEMIRLMEYQWAYEAAARLIQSSREMIQAVLDLVR